MPCTAYSLFSRKWKNECSSSAKTCMHEIWLIQFCLSYCSARDPGSPFSDSKEVMLCIGQLVNAGKKWKGTAVLTQKFLGLPFFFNKYNSYDCTSYNDRKKKKRETGRSMYWSSDQLSHTKTHSDFHVSHLFPLTYNRHCTERHNQWKRSKGVRRKHPQFSQNQQKKSTPPCLGFEIGSGIFGTCQPDMAVFLEKNKSTEAVACMMLFNTGGRINICFMILTWRLSAILITRCPKIASNAPIKFSCKNKINIQILHLPTGPCA